MVKTTTKATTQKDGNARRRAARLRNANNTRSSYLSYQWGNVTQPTSSTDSLKKQRRF
jgi:hypothetical protein